MKNCPCGSGRLYTDCCLQYISGRKKAPTAEALMRARYSAYAEHEIDFIINTYAGHNKHEIDYEGTREQSEKSNWLGLKIITVEKGGINDSDGMVEFEALYFRDGLINIHHEKALFKKEESNEGSQWIYQEGRITITRTTSKTGRNDPCPCGSGKKYKHCCLNKQKGNLYHDG